MSIRSIPLQALISSLPISAGNREARGAFYSMALFIYGFLVIIILIAVFNIVNSIAMSVSARIRQYGAMRAIGMSVCQLIGYLIGLPLHKMLFEQMVTAHWGDPWQLPLGMLAIIVAVVMISSILAVHGPAKQIHKMSIVDAISAQLVSSWQSQTKFL